MILLVKSPVALRSTAIQRLLSILLGRIDADLLMRAIYIKIVFIVHLADNVLTRKSRINLGLARLTILLQGAEVR